MRSMFIVLNKKIYGREEKRYYLFQGMEPQSKMNLKKNDFFQIKKMLKKTLDSNNNIKIINEYNRNQEDKENKKQHNIFVKRKKFSRNILLINYIILIILFIQKIMSMKMRIFSIKYEIILKIKENNNNKLFGKLFSNYPDDIKINGEIVKNETYIFNKENNIVELKWNNGINNCGCMFDGNTYITEINLSNFDTSKVTNMNMMFSGCRFI